VKVLVLGSGGREHALAWRLRQDPDVSEVIVAPGNPGIAGLGRAVPVNVADPASMLDLAVREQVDLTVVGPEAFLELGVADLFRQHGRPIFGPTRRGAALECSKVAAKHFMARADIPTARFAVCTSADEAMAAISGPTFGFPVVVKADGLAAGKGVVVAADRAEAEQAIRTIMIDRRFGAAGAAVVIEECLTGPEVSFFALCDGRTAVPRSTAQDHKRIWDDDRGPNTGGMGAFAPSPLVDDEMTAFVMRRIVDPVLDGLRAEGEPFCGFLYVSLMLTAAGPKVIEFNVRFGDPEAQVILPLLEGPFARTLFDAANGRLSGAPLTAAAGCAVGVVLASRGYPEGAEHGREIHGLDRASVPPGVLVFHSGTKIDAGTTVTAGGRVLTVVGRAATYEQAMETAYRAVDTIHFDGMQYRRDIGRKALTAGVGPRANSRSRERSERAEDDK
jgi:phosphoribosylamine--glycine ligase